MRKGYVIALAVIVAYGAFSLFVPPRMQFNIARFASTSIGVDHKSADDVFAKAESALTSVEAYIASRKNEQFAARLADLVQRQEKAKIELASLEAQLVDPRKRMQELTGAVADLEKALGTVEKDDKGQVSKHVSEASARVGAFKERIETLRANSRQIDSLKSELVAFETALQPLRHAQTGPVALMKDLRAHMERTLTELNTLERGDPGVKTGNTLEQQVDTLEKDLASAKRRAQGVQSLLDRAVAVGAQVGISPAGQKATAQKQ